MNAAALSPSPALIAAKSRGFGARGSTSGRSFQAPNPAAFRFPSSRVPGVPIFVETCRRSSMLLRALAWTCGALALFALSYVTAFAVLICALIFWSGAEQGGALFLLAGAGLYAFCAACLWSWRRIWERRPQRF